MKIKRIYSSIHQRIIYYFAIICLSCFYTTISFATTTLTDIEKQRYQKLTYELRCLVCQNQNIADSNAPLAADLRRKISNMIQTGYDDKEIKEYLVKRYGNFILYRPPFNETTIILWVAPFILLCLSIVLLIRKLTRKST